MVTKYFSTNYDGKEAIVKNLCFAVNEKNIANTTKLPREGENCFKGFIISPKHYIQFLTKDHQNADWVKGIP